MGGHRGGAAAGGPAAAGSEPRRAAAVIAGIGVLAEGPLHSALKAILAGPDDRVEVTVGRFVVDVVRADGELVEIQTGAFGPLGAKLDALLDEHRVRIVHPIPAESRIVRVDAHGEVLSARRSPKRASAVAIFDKLVAFPSLISHPHLTIEVLLLREDHVRAAGPTRVRHRTRDPGQRRLVAVLERLELGNVGDLMGLVPELPSEPFTTRELSRAAGCGLVLAQRIVYCLRAVELLEPAGRRGPAPLHRLAGR